MITIYAKNGTAKAYARKITLEEKFMDIASVNVEISSPVPVDFAIDDYIDYSYNGRRYLLKDLAKVKKQARRNTYGDAFQSSVTFHEQTWELENCPFLDLVPAQQTAVYSSLPDVTVYAKPQNIVERIQANLDSFYGEGEWEVFIPSYITDPTVLELLDTYKDISLSQATCKGALDEIYRQWGLAWIFNVSYGQKQIVVAYAADMTGLFKYGKGQGLRTITIEQKDASSLATRIYPYGSTENLPARWYNDHPLDSDTKYIDEYQYIPHLMLPPSMWHGGTPDGNYVEDATAIAKYGLRPKTVYFEGGDYNKIMPSISGLTAKDIRDAKTETGDTSNVPSTTFYPDATRMDRTLTGDDTEDNGVSDGYEPYSESEDFSFAAATQTVGIINPEVGGSGTSEGGHNAVYSENMLFYLGEVTLEEIAQYLFTFTSGGITVSVGSDLAPHLSGLTLTPVLNLWNGSGSGIETIGEGTPVSMQAGSQSWTETFSLSSLFSNADVKYKIFQNQASSLPVIPKVYLGFIIDYTFNTAETLTERPITFALSAGTGNCARGVTQIANSFTIKLKQIGFDIMACKQAANENRQINMKSGLCAGYSFNILKSVYNSADDSWTLTCHRTTDTELKIAFPNADRHIAAEDEFVLTGIEMPDIYVYAAMEKLYEQAMKVLAELSKPKMVYVPEIDNQQIAKSPQVLHAGMIFQTFDTDLSIPEQLPIDSLQVSEDGQELRKFSVTLRNEKTDSLLRQINMIAHTEQGGVTERQVSTAINQALNSYSSGEETQFGGGTGSGSIGVMEQGDGNAVTGLVPSAGILVAKKDKTFVDIDSAQTVTGSKKLKSVSLLNVPASAPASADIETGKFYLYATTLGEYSETPGGGGGGTGDIYSLTITKNGSPWLSYDPSSAAVNTNLTIGWSDLTEDASHKFVSQTEKDTWNAKLTSIPIATSSVIGGFLYGDPEDTMLVMQNGFLSLDLLKYLTTTQGIIEGYGYTQKTQAIPYIVGPDSDATAGTWHGTYEGITALTEGLTIVYVPHVAGATTTTLNINGLGAKTCYWTGTSKMTTQYPVGTPILLTYHNNGWRRADANTTYSAGTKALFDAGTNTSNRVWSASVLASAVAPKEHEHAWADITGAPAFITADALNGYATETYVGNQIAALNLGTASQKNYTTSVAQNGTDLPTSGAVYSAIAAAVTSALHYRGMSSTALTDGGTETATIGGQPLVAQSGDVVIYNGFEFLWENNVWNKLGDDSSYALKTVQISAGTGLTGGGDLTTSRTIGLSTSTQTDIGKGVTAYGWGDHSQAGYLTSFTETDPTVPAWAKASTKPSYDYDEIENTPFIPTNVSDLTNDAGYISTETDPVFSASAAHGITSSNISSWNGKYTKPSGGIPKADLASAVQTSLEKADTALQSYTETDPTVPAWAKNTSLAASDVPTLAISKISGLQDALDGKQPLDADLTAIAALTGSGLLRRNSDNTWGLDTNTYLTSSDHKALTLKVGAITIGSDFNSLAAKTYTITKANLTDTIGDTTYAPYNADGYVPTTRKVNGHALSTDVTVTKGDVGLGNVENTALSTWAGSSNITTLGTITTGVWNGTAIANQYLANSSVAINGKSVSLGGSVSLNLDDIGDGTSKTWDRIVFTDTVQSITGKKTMTNVSVTGYLAVPKIAPASPVTGDIYLWADADGNYSETASGGGVANIYDLTIRRGSVSVGTYNLGEQAADIDLSSLFSGYATESWVSANFNNYVLPTASASVLGGVKVGSGLSIDASGVLTNAITATASVDSNTGNPSVAVTINNGNISFAFSNLKGDQGNSGYSGTAGELEVVNNLNDGGATAALSAEMGKQIGDNISQLGQEVIIDGAERSEFAYSQLSSATPNIQLPTSIAFEQVGDFVEIKAKAKDAGFLFRRDSSYNQPRIKYTAANTLTIRMTSADSVFSLQDSSVNWAAIQTIKILLAAHPTDTTWDFEYYLDGSKIGTKTVTTSGAAAFFNQIGYTSTADVYYVRGITNGVPFAYTKLSEIQSATGITDIYETVSVPSLLELDNRLGIAEQGIAALEGKVDGEDMFYSYRKSVSTYNISSAFYIYQRLKNDIYTRTTIGYYNYSGSAGYPNGYWRIERINIGTIINGVWTNIQDQVITAGENEFVLQWLAGTGYNFSGGFSGGYHYGETIDNVADAWVEFVANGNWLSTDMDIPITPCKSFYYREYSPIYQHNDNTIAAWHLKETIFKDGGYETMNDVKFVQALDYFAYPGIVCVSRWLSEKAMPEGVATITDMGDGSTTIPEQFKSNGHSIHYEGNGYACDVTSEVRFGADDTQCQRVVYNSSTYNKFYRRNPDTSGSTSNRLCGITKVRIKKN